MTPPPGRIVDEASGHQVELPEVCVLGRSPEATVVIDDPRASRRHALIRLQPDGYWFFDLGSMNGSTINGRRVTTARRLEQNDRIVIAGRTLRFEGGRDVPTRLGETGDATLASVQPTRAILLVSDIWGFTSLSEQLDPNILARIIGSWYSLTGSILDAAGATVDKFIGDCVLAYWLNTSPATRQTALETADHLRNATRNVHEQHASTFQSLGRRFRSGVALHCGDTVYGAFSAQEFTLIGDAVNLVFRLESLTRSLDEPVLLSSDFLGNWDEGRAACRPIGPHSVKGRDEPVDVWVPASP